MAKWPENLRAHASILDSKEVSFVGQLLAAGQAHLFEDWDTVGTYDDEKKVFLAQLQKLHDTYPLSGGLFTYLQRAKDLLRDSKKGKRSQRSLASYPHILLLKNLFLI